MTTKPVRFGLMDMLSVGRQALHLMHRLDAEDGERVLLELSIERLMITFGEAAGQLPKSLLDREPSVAWSGITGLRHVLVHDYDEVDEYRLMAAVRVSRPEAVAAIERLLAEET